MEVRRSKIQGAGLGVFATRNYLKDELIERSGFIVVQDTPDCLLGHCFDSGDPKKTWVYFGKMALINHSTEENVYHCQDHERILEFYAKENIKRGKEFVINYGENAEEAF